MPYSILIDSVSLAKKHQESKNETLLCPIVSFRNLMDVDNFYLFTFKKETPETMMCANLKVWQVSVLEDTYLPEWINKNVNIMLHSIFFLCCQ